MKAAISATTAVLLIASVALAARISIHRTATTDTSLSIATAINATAYTGWIPVGDKRSVALEITYVNSAATAVTMSCETSDVASTTAGAGWDIHILEDSTTSGTSDSIPHVWSNAVGGDESWTWTVANLPQRWIQCWFDGTSADGSDTVVVRQTGISP